VVIDRRFVGAQHLCARDSTARTNNVLKSYHVSLHRRIQVTEVTHPNLSVFLTHLQKATADSMADMLRVRNDIKIRRATKKKSAKRHSHSSQRGKQCFIQTPSIGGKLRLLGVDDRAPKARGRVVVGDETETEASRGGEWGGGIPMGRGYPPPQPTRGSGERRELPQRGPGGAPVENKFGAL